MNEKELSILMYKILDQFKDLQYQNDVIRKNLNKLTGVYNALSFRVNILENPEDEEECDSCSEGIETEGNEGDESPPMDQLLEKMDDFIDAMHTLRDIMKKGL